MYETHIGNHRYCVF